MYVFPVITYNADDYEAMYLDWLNSFLTVSKFAEHYGIGEVYAQHIIERGRIQHLLKVELTNE